VLEDMLLESRLEALGKRIQAFKFYSRITWALPKKIKRL
jgi:hypothetical protein